MVDKETLERVGEQVDKLVEATQSLAIQSAVQSSTLKEVRDILDGVTDKCEGHEILLTKHKLYFAICKWLLGSSFGVGGILGLIKFLG